MTENEYDPNDASQYDDVLPFIAVMDAWTAPWPDTAWQAECRAEVAKLMPALARSLDRMAIEDATVVPKSPASSPPAVEDEEDDTYRGVDLLEGACVVVGDAPVSPKVLAAANELRDKTEDEAQYLDHLLLSNYDVSDMNGYDREWAQREAYPDLSAMTVEELGARARRATDRLRAWGRRHPYIQSAIRESALREQIIIHLNNMDSVRQKDIAEMIGVSAGRINQLIGEYYNRLELEHQDQGRARR